MKKVHSMDERREVFLLLWWSLFSFAVYPYKDKCTCYRPQSFYLVASANKNDNAFGCSTPKIICLQKQKTIILGLAVRPTVRMERLVECQSSFIFRDYSLWRQNIRLHPKNVTSGKAPGNNQTLLPTVCTFQAWSLNYSSVFIRTLQFIVRKIYSSLSSRSVCFIAICNFVFLCSYKKGHVKLAIYASPLKRRH